jgi:hypothetical protein
MLGVSMVAAAAALLVMLIVGSWSGAEQQASSPVRIPKEAKRFSAPGPQAGDREVVDQRSETSRTFRRADGSFHTLVSAAPLNYRDADGAWKPIDTSLQPDGVGGLRTAAAGTEVRLPASLQQPAKVADGARWLSFDLQGADAVAPSAKGDTATYADAVQGVDARYTALATGVKETLTVTDRGAPSEYVFALDASAGLTAQLQPDGGVAVSDAAGHVRFRLPAPTVQAAGQDAPSTDHVAYRLEDGGRRLRVVVDEQWLAAAPLPVQIDPTIYTGSWDSCTLISGDQSQANDCNGQWLRVGDDGDHVYRSVIRFNNADFDIPRIATVTRASLDLTFPSQSVFDAETEVDVLGLAQTITDQATWETYDGTHEWDSHGGDTTALPQSNPNWMYQDYIPDWVNFDISALAQRWVRDPADNHGLLLRAHDEGAGNVLTFGGQAYANGGPTLDIIYTLPAGLDDAKTHRTIQLGDHEEIAVDVASGNLAVHGHDIHLPSTTGPDLDLTRTYNGQSLGHEDGIFASAWTESINDAAFASLWWWLDDQRVIYANGGTAYRFDRDYANDTAGTLAYTTPPGIDADLTEDTDTGQSTLTFRTSGIQWIYGWTTDWEHMMLQRIDDGQGHHTEITARTDDPSKIDTITDADGHELQFAYDTTDGHLASITDTATGRHWDYATNSVDGHLVLTSATDADDNTTTYTYADDLPGIWDRLSTITPPDGHAIDIEYGPDGDAGQITKITRHPDDDPAHDQLWRFDYTPEANVGETCDATVNGHTVIGRTVVTDPDDAKVTYCYDNTGTVVQTLQHEAVAPSSTTPPTISGTAREGERLTVSPGTWAGDEPITYAYQWQRCDTAGANCADIDGATDDDYRLSEGDRDGTVVAIVTATNDGGSTSAASEPTDMVAVGEPRNDSPPVIDGDPAVGKTLTASDGDWSLSAPLTITRQWQRCDSAGALCHDLAGATGETYTLTPDDLRATVRVVVTATGSGGTTRETSDITDRVAPAAPSNTALPVISGDTADGAMLTATHGTWSATGTLDYTYQWRRCDTTGAHCANVDGENDATYTLSADDLGTTLRVMVTADDGRASTHATSAPTATITARPPLSTVAPSLSGTTIDGRQLTASRGTWSGSEPMHETFRWRRCDTAGTNCQDIDGVTAGTYTLRSGDVGATLVAVVTATNDAGAASATTAASATVLPAPPAGATVPTISGTAMAGDTLTVEGDRWTGTNPTFAYQWRRCDTTGASCSDISGATSNTYTPVLADVAHTVRAVVTAINAAGSATATSAPTAEVVPEATFTAAISGVAQIPTNGTDEDIIGVLRAVPGDPGGPDPVTFTYQWQRCNGAGQTCANIAAETGRTYNVQPTDRGRTLRVVVTATDGNDVVSTAISPATAAVTSRFATSYEQVLPAVAGHVAVGSSVTASPGDWPVTTTLTYEWQRCDADGVACSPIPGATSSAYVIQSADAGFRLAVAVTGTDAAGAATLISRPSNVVSLESMVNTAAPTLTAGAGPEGTVLTATTGTWSSALAGEISYSYQWQRCDPDGLKCVRLAGEQAATYALGADDVGRTIRALVVASDEGGSATARSAASAVVEAAAPTSSDAPTIHGAAREDAVLSADGGTWTGVGTVELSHQWRRCDAAGAGCADIAGADQAEYTPAAEDAGHRLRVVVTASNDAGSATATSAATAIVTAAGLPGPGPDNTFTPTLAGATTVGQTLTADAGLWTGTGSITYTYQWQTCDPDGACDDIPLATGDSLTLTSLQAGALVKVLVTATDADGSATAAVQTGQTITSGSDIVLNAAPVISGTVQEGEELTVSQGAWTHADPLAFAVQWQSCVDGPDTCESIPDATQFTYTPDAGDRRLRAVVVASDTDGHHVSALSAITAPVVAVSPVALGLPVVSGTPVMGQTLHATAPAWDGAAPIVATYQWSRCDTDDSCEEIDGATTADYELGSADLGRTLEVEATGTNGYGSDATRSERTVAVVDADAPSASTLPTIDGLAVVGQTLTADHGTWTTTGAATYSYQWLRCDTGGASCQPIDGQTGDSFEITDQEAFATVRVAVTAQDDVGEATVRSAATAMIDWTPPTDDTPIANTERPTVSGTARPGLVLEADPGTWTGPADLSHQYRWRACDADGECAVIDDATDPYYVPTVDQVGLRIGVLVTAVSGAAAVTATSELTRAVVDGQPQWTDYPYINWRDGVQGETVSVFTGATTDPDAQLTVTWQRCNASGSACSEIAGADGEQYTLSADDVGATVRAEITAANDFGSVSDTSWPIGPVQGELVNVTPPSLTGDAVAGQTLALDYGQWTATASTFTALWQRCDASGESCSDLDVAPWETYYQATKDDVGHRIKATVTAANAAGQVTLEAGLSDVVVRAILPVNTQAPWLGGTAEVGEYVTAGDGYWSGGRDTVDHDWLRCDASGARCHEIEGAHEDLHRVTRSDAGHTLRALVTVTYAGGSASARSAATTVVPAPPAISALNIPTIDMPGGTEAGNFVQETAPGAWAGFPQTVSRQWQRCVPATTPLQCTDIPGATDNYYNTSSQDVGHLLRIAETASDPTSAPVTAYSAPTATPVSAVAHAGGLSISGPRAAGQTITATLNAWTQVPMPMRFNYRFERSDGTTSTVVQEGPDAGYQLTDADVGQQIVITATATVMSADETTVLDSTDATTTLFGIATRVANDSAPTVSGSVAAGAQLTAARGTWHGGGSTLTYTYAWQRCDTGGEGCEDIDGATTTTYRSTGDDIGHTLRIEVSARPNVTGAQAVHAVSTVTAPITATNAPQSTTPPTISGDPVERRVLTANHGAWSSADPITYTYQWRRCDPDPQSEEDCQDIDLATQAQYTATADDVGSPLYVIVTATNASGSNSVGSDITEPVAVGDVPALRSAPSMTLLGTPDPGSTLLTDGGDWDGAGEDDVTYLWQRCDWLGANCETIDGANAQSYDLTEDDVDHQIRITVTAQNDAGTNQATSQLSETITAGPEGLMRAFGTPARKSAADRIVFYDYEKDTVYSDSTSQSLRLVDQDGTDATTVATCGELTNRTDCELGHPRISPNLKMIAVENHPVQPSFARSNGGGDGIYVINYDGSRPRWLANGWDPVWSPDGTKVLFTGRGQNGQTTALIARADGRHIDSPKTLLTFGGHFANTPELASNGSIVFAGGSSWGDGDDLYFRGAKDKSPHRIPLPTRFASVSEPRFTADENAVTFLAVMGEDYDNDHYRLTSGWRVNTDGSGLTRMTPDDNQVYAPGAAGTDLYTTAAAQYHCLGYDTHGNCNGFSVLGGTLMVGGTSGSDLRSLGVGTIDNPAKEPSPAPTARAAAQLPVEIQKCDYGLGTSTNEPDPGQHLTRGVIVAAVWELKHCDADVKGIDAKICLEAANATNDSDPHAGIRSWPGKGLCTDINWRPYDLQRTIIAQQICYPGVHWYRASFRDVKYTLLKGKQVAALVGGESHPKFPIDCNEAGAWTYLAYHKFTKDLAGNINTFDDNNPRETLARNLGRGRLPNVFPGARKPGRNRGFEAHHILPIEDSALVRQYAYACFTYRGAPNSRRNGIWLRGYRLRSNNESKKDPNAAEEFSALENYDRDHGTNWHLRQYHPSLRTNRYYQEVVDRLRAATGPDRNWTCDRGTANEKMSQIYHDLSTGTMPR